MLAECTGSDSFEQQNVIKQALINWKRDRVWQDVQHLVLTFPVKSRKGCG
nr:hypothetical protein [Dendronalium sp. ChiSLP03b]MDZ8203446.1 hypothetical protein [Dendronalium sp. ChiSLP03b]